MNGTSTNPFFSVVIPTYNRCQRVQNTLESVLQQSYDSFEVIVVDDGSTDRTFENLNEEYAQNRKVRIIRQENKERGAARNLGIKESSGNYIQFIDSDDFMYPDHLQTLHTKIKALDHPDYIASKYEIEREGKIHMSDLNKLREAYYDYHLFLQGNPLACNICIKKENPSLLLFEEDRNYSIKEDWMFMISNLRHGKLYLIDKVTIRLSDHDDRSMRSDQQLIIKRTFLARNWILEHVPLNNEELRKLDAHVNYFSSIHSYIDDKNMAGLSYLFKAIKYGGLKLKYLVLFVKLIIGKKLIGNIKGFIR